MEVLVCDKCGWRADGTMMEEKEPELPREPPEGECIIPNVPLYPPLKRPRHR